MFRSFQKKILVIINSREQFKNSSKLSALFFGHHLPNSKHRLTEKDEIEFFCQNVDNLSEVPVKKKCWTKIHNPVKVTSLKEATVLEILILVHCSGVADHANSDI